MICVHNGLFITTDHKNNGFGMAPFGKQMFILKIQFFCDVIAMLIHNSY